MKNWLFFSKKNFKDLLAKSWRNIYQKMIFSIGRGLGLAARAPGGRRIFEHFQQTLKKIAKMHYFRIFLDEFNRKFITASRVWTMPVSSKMQNKYKCRLYFKKGYNCAGFEYYHIKPEIWWFFNKRFFKRIFEENFLSKKFHSLWKCN